MSYIKQTWEDLPSTNTPITASALNHIEDGIGELSYNVITDGNEVKTGRQIDGYDEYVKRITLDNFPDTNVTKTWATGLNMTNLIMTDLKIMVKPGSGNWFSLPNNDVVNSKTSLYANGDIAITVYTGNLHNHNGYAEIYYYHTS